MAETLWAIPEGFEEVKVAPWQGPQRPNSDIPEGFEVVDITKDDPETTALRVAAMTARANVPRSEEWWADQRAAAARADADPMSRAPAIVREPYRAIAGATTNILGTVARPFSKDAADALAETGEQISADSEALRKDDWSPWMSRMYGGAAESLAQSAVAAPLGPAGIIGSFALTEGNQALYEAEQAGLTGSDRIKYAVVQGAIEGAIAGVFQKFAPGLERFIPKIASGAMKTNGKQFLKMTAEEIPEELLTELGHAVAEASYGVDPNAMNQENFLPRAIDTVAQTLMTLGLAQGAAKVTQRRQPAEAPETAPAAPEAESKLEQLQAIREKGFVSEEDGKSIGLPPEEMQSRKTRKAAVEKRIQDAQKELERASETAPPAPQEAAPEAPPPLPRQGRRPVEQAPAAPSETAPAAPEAPPAIPDTDPPIPKGMTRLYHGSGEPGRYTGPAWYSTNRDYAANYREGGELQYIDVPTEWANQQADPDGYGNTPDKGFTLNTELQQDEFGPRKPIKPASSMDDAKQKATGLAELMAKKRAEATQAASAPPSPTPPQKPPEAEPASQYPPGTKLKIAGYENDFEVSKGHSFFPDGTLIDTTTNRPMSADGGAEKTLRNYKPEQITVVSEPAPAAPEPLPPSPRQKAIEGKQPLRSSPTEKDEVEADRQVQELRKENKRKKLLRKDGVVQTIAGKMDLDEFETKGYAVEQVTREDWVNLQRANRRKLGQLEESGPSAAPFADYEQYHEQAVRDAVKRGEEVDPEVLQDYPDLASKPPTQPQDASEAESGPTVVPKPETIPEAVQEPEAGPKRERPEFRDWRFTSGAKNSGKIVPNRVGRKFTDEQVQSLVSWAKSQGLEVVGASPTGFKVVGKPGERLDLSLLGAVGLKREQADAAARERKAQEDERRQAREQQAGGRKSASWIADTFGDAMNAYNRNALADFVEGGTTKFEGMVSPQWQEGLEKIGATNAQGGIDWKKVKAAYEGATAVSKPPSVTDSDIIPPEAGSNKAAVEHGSLPMFSVYPTQFRGVKKYAVKEFDRGGFGDAMFDTEAEAQDEADRAKRRNEEDVARAAKAKADAEVAEKQQKDYEDSFGGFLSDDPKTKGRQLKTLGANLKYKGKVTTRKALIESKVADGWTVTAEGRLQGPDESFLDARDLTETGIKYARHLASAKPPSVTDSDIISVSPPEAGSGKDSEAETGRETDTVSETPPAEAPMTAWETEEAERMRGARQSAREIGVSNRYWKEQRKRAEKIKGTKGKVSVALTEEVPDEKAGKKGKKKVNSRGDRPATILNEKWAIVELEGDGKKSFSLTHVPSGLNVAAYDKATDAKALYVFLQEAGVDLDAIPDDGNVPGNVVSDAKTAIDAFNHDDIARLTPEQRDLVVALVETTPSGVTADIVLDAYDLGVFGGTRMKDETGRIKKLAKELPEFAYNPVFTVDAKKNLVFQDGFRFSFDPQAFNLHPSEVKEGQTVGINLDDLGVKRPEPEAVVKAVLEREFTVKKGGKKQGGLNLVRLGSKIGDTIIVSGGGHNWSVTSGTGGADAKRAQQLLDGIPWTRKEQIAKNEAAADVAPAEEESAEQAEVNSVVDKLLQWKNSERLTDPKDFRTSWMGYEDAQQQAIVRELVERGELPIGFERRKTVTASQILEELPRRLASARYKTPKTKLQQSADAALDDAKAKADKLLKKVKGKGLASNPMLDPEIIAETAGVVYAYSKAGILKFAAFTEQLAKDIGQSYVDDLLPALKSEWNKLHATGEFEGMTDADGKSSEKLSPVFPTTSGDTTGTKNAKTDELREKLGLADRVIPTTQTQEELDAAAERMMKADPLLGSRLASELYDNPRALEDPVLEHVMGRHIRDLENRREDGEDVADELLIAIEASEKVGTLEGRVFRARQEVRAPDFSLPGILRQHSDTVGEEPSRDEQAKYAELADQVKTLEADKADLQQKLVEEQVARAAAEAAKSPAKAKLGTKKATLQKKADDAIANFKKAWAALGQMGIISDPKAEAEKLKAIERAAIDVVKVYAELGVNSAVEFMAGVAKAFKGITAKQKKAFQAAWDEYEKSNPIPSPLGADPDKSTLGARAKALTRAAVESGIEDWNAVIDAVHEQMAKEVPGFTRPQTMEAISDYGQYRLLSKDAIDVKVRAIRGKARQALKLEDLNKAITASRKWLDEGMSPEDVAQKLHDQDLLPKATGSERATPDSIERGLIAEFNRLKKDLPVSTATREGQLKSAMSTAKTSARNRLEDYGKEIEALEEAIAKRVALEKTSDRVPLTPDAELADMQKRVAERRQKRDELKEQYETIFPPTKKQRQITAQQQTKRAEQAIDKLKQELKDLQSGKEKSAAQKPNLVPAQLQQQLQMWRERLKTARKAAQEADAARWEDEGGAVMPPVGRKPLTDEQRLKMAEDMVRRQTEIVKADIKALEQGTWKPAEAGKPLTSETKAKLQQELEALKGIREQARKASPQYQAREEAKYWEGYRKAQERQLEFWENRLRDAEAGILPKPRKKRTPTEKAILDKTLEIEAVQYRALAEIEKAKRANYNVGQWIGEGITEATSTLPRTLMAGMEMSVVGRQGVFYTASHPIMALSNLARSMQAIFSQRIALANTEDIKSRPNFREYGLGDVEFTQHDGPAKELEEMYASGIIRWLDKTEGKLFLPLRAWAKAYMGFERGFSNFRNTMTADLYDIQKRDTLAIRNFFNKIGVESRPWGETDIQAAGRSANIWGGRGTGLKSGSKALNWFFFARRWVWATLQREFILPFQLATPKAIGQWNGDAAMRVAHAKLYAQFAIGMAANLAAQYWLYKLLSDDDDEQPEISFDWISTDLLKLKIGETRIDFLGGMQQPIVLAARVLSGKSMNAEGEVYSLYNDGGDEKPWRDSADVLIQWGRGKLGPGPSGILDWLSGQNLIGEPKTKTDIVLERIQPMTYRELWQAEDELGLKRGTITALDGFFGAGVNTYGPRTEYRNASEAERLKMVEKDLKNLKWDAPLEPAYAEFLTEDQLQAFRDRRTEKRQSVLLAATHEPLRENHKSDETFAESVATRDKNLGFLREMQAEGVSKDEALQLLYSAYEQGGMSANNYRAREAKLEELYGE